MQEKSYYKPHRILDEFERLVYDSPQQRSKAEIKWAELRRQLRGAPCDIAAAIDLCVATLPLAGCNEVWEEEMLSLKRSIEDTAFAPIWTEQWNWVKLFCSSLEGKLPAADRKVKAKRRKLTNKLTEVTLGIDIRALEIQSSRQRGIGRYLTNLIGSMVQMAPDTKFIFYGNAFSWEIGSLDGLLNNQNTEYKNYHPSFSDEFDAFLFTDPLPLLNNSVLLPFTLNDKPAASIVYDLIPLAYAKEYLVNSPELHRQYIEKIYELQQICGTYLPISEFVGKELEDRLGIDCHDIYPIMGGLDPVFQSCNTLSEEGEIKSKLNLPERYFIYAGGLDYRKNLKRSLEAFAKVKQSTKDNVKFVLVGEANKKLREAYEKDSAVNTVLDDIITLGYINDNELKYVYSKAVAFVFPSLYEGFGLPALEAMSSGCPVIISNGSSLKEIAGEAALVVNPMSVTDIANAMSQMLSDTKLRNDFISKGYVNAKNFSWKSVAEKTMSVMYSLLEPKRSHRSTSRKMRVLLQNRDNVFLERGGDTVVMEELYRGLMNLDVEVEVHCGTPDLSNYDLIHIVNSTLTDLTDKIGQNALKYSKPYTITTLFEDWPRYMDKSYETINLFKRYIETGQSQSAFDAGLIKLNQVNGALIPSKYEILRNAAGLIVCGESERNVIEQYYRELKNDIFTAKFGIKYDPIDKAHAKNIISNTLKIDEFILCCGRLETRKNQLMLLKAMENSDLPIVFATGGFSYQRPYVELVHKFQRKGKNYFLGKLEQIYRDCIMAAASVHVLPSWYELPGLVTLEAAAHGTAVVASDWGAITDYLEKDQFQLCAPDDPDSIRDAVERALKCKNVTAAQEAASLYTWKKYAETMHQIFESILSRQKNNYSEVASYINNKQTNHIFTEETMSVSQSQQSKYEVSIIIPVYNQSHLTRQCIQAISECADKASYELIIVDNHSTDDTQQILQAIEGDVKIIRESQNQGFAVACNHGARVADGNYLIFLNNDTLPNSGWIDELVKTAKRTENLGAVGVKLLYPNGKVQHAGVAISDKKIPYHIFQNFAGDHPAVNEEREMKIVTAACMLVPKQVFIEANGFDEGYRNSFEDVDFCLRISEQNRKVVYNPKVSMIHLEQSTEGRTVNDGMNLDRFLEKWSSKLKQDDQSILNKFGYKIVWSEKGGRYEQIEDETADTSNDIMLADAKETYAQGKIEEASAMLQNYVKNKMTLAGDEGFEAWQTLGNCFTRLNQAEKAEEAYLQAMKINTESERPYLGLASVALLKENWLAAQYGFMSALAKNPNSVKGKYGVGLTLAARNQYAQAIEQFKTALEQEPFNQEVLFSLYKAAMESGEPQEAIEPIIDYLEKYPSDTNFLFNLCGAFWKSGQLSEAAEICTKILTIDSNHEAAKEVMQHLSESLALNV